MEHKLSFNEDKKFSSKLFDERVLNPLFLSSTEELHHFIEAEKPGCFHSEVKVGSWSFVVFGLLDKNQPESPIIDLKFVSELSKEKTGFIDVLLEFCLNKNEQTLKFLKFREVENFLRDSNIVPSLPDNGIQYYPLFEKTITTLQRVFTESRGYRAGVALSPTIADDYVASNPLIFDSSLHGSFLELSIQEQSHFLNQVFAKHIRPFLYRDRGDVEILFIDGNMIVINYLGACAQCTKSLTSTMDYIQTVLRLELSEPTLLLITDS